ncbi:glycosyltransferase family A protein [Microbulbifer sp. 2205BS26-8]|uniref:glycosyltransferase family 2 protein n=1 Tax=Microbulbifer sp. 2205BS26-8 TaxID=3064386 RepID=UPI00273E8DF3|nr:glycosyltransferase family A protein [Microbulbifer sp. 2205BS26-8]MDP5209203.1 glycosyltransferase family A protein [Microbulbifer sp. 2205BS26-8]
MNKVEYFSEILGPIVHLYLAKLDQYISYLDDGKTKILFCSRAGVRIKNLYENYLYNKGRVISEHSDLFWISRFLLCKALASKDWSLVKRYWQVEYFNKSAEELIKGIFNSEDSKLYSGVNYEAIAGQSAMDYLSAIIQKREYTNFISHYLSEQGRNFDGYLHSLVDGYERVVLVDSGWQGTIQTLLTKIYKNLDWYGLMFGRVASPNTDRSCFHNMVGLSFEINAGDDFRFFDENHPETSLSLHRHIIENLFEPNAPSIEAIHRDGEKFFGVGVDKILNEDCSEDDDYLGVEKYISLVNRDEKYSTIIANCTLASKKLAKKIIFPTLQDLSFLGGMKRSVDFGSKASISVLLEPVNRFDGDSKSKRIKDSLWEFGQISIEFQGDSDRKQSELLNSIARMQEVKGNTGNGWLQKDSVPIVAIITRTKDRPVLLKRAAESVEKQTFKNYVWVIVNDGGELSKVENIINLCGVDKRKIILVNNPISLGMEAASNSGIHSSKSKYIVIHDDDDSWEPKFLEKTVEFLECSRNKNYKGVITDTQYVSEEIIDSHVKIHGSWPYNNWVNTVHIMEMACGNFFPPIAFVFLRSVYDEIGGFDESLPVLGDWDFNLRFLNLENIGVVKECLANYHHRDVNSQGDSSYSNSVIGGISKHQEYEPIVRNKFIRGSVNGGEVNLGVLVNLGMMMREIRSGVEDLKKINDTVSAEALYSDIGKGTLRRKKFLEDLIDFRWAHSGRNPGKVIPPDFDEGKYLLENADVAQSVSEGGFVSGYEHYILHGKNEGRNRPLVVDSSLLREPARKVSIKKAFKRLFTKD